MAIYVNDVLVSGDGVDGKDATINGVNALTLQTTGGLTGQQSGDTYTIDGSGLEAMQSANIQDGGQTAGNVTLKAYGDKPTIDIPVRLIVRGH